MGRGPTAGKCSNCLLHRLDPEHSLSPFTRHPPTGPPPGLTQGGVQRIFLQQQTANLGPGSWCSSAPKCAPSLLLKNHLIQEVASRGFLSVLSPLKPRAQVPTFMTDSPLNPSLQTSGLPAALRAAAQAPRMAHLQETVTRLMCPAWQEPCSFPHWRLSCTSLLQPPRSGVPHTLSLFFPSS